MMNYIYVHVMFIGAGFPGMFRQKYCDICVIDTEPCAPMVKPIRSIETFLSRHAAG